MNLDILVVDDDAIVLFLHKTLVKKSQDLFPVYAFESAEQALIHVRENKEHSAFLILLDINMPSMSGWEFLEQLQTFQVSGDIFVAMVTSSINKSDKAKAENYPLIISFMEKPLSRQSFLELFDSVKQKMGTF